MVRGGGSSLMREAGALLGRAVAAGVKMGVGIVIVVIGVFAALRA